MVVKKMLIIGLKSNGSLNIFGNYWRISDIWGIWDEFLVIS